MEFAYSIVDKSRYILVSLTGNLMEKNQANDLLDDVNHQLEKEAANFIIDLSGLKYMNSTGLGVLLNILSNARKTGGEVVICAVPEKIKTLLIITKLVNVFSVVKDEQQAAEIFTGSKV